MAVKSQSKDDSKKFPFTITKKGKPASESKKEKK